MTLLVQDAILDLLKSAVDAVYHPSTNGTTIGTDQPSLSPSRSSACGSHLSKRSVCDEDKEEQECTDTIPSSNGVQHQTSSVTNTTSPRPPSPSQSNTISSDSNTIICRDELADFFDDNFTSSSDEDAENTPSEVVSKDERALLNTKQGANKNFFNVLISVACIQFRWLPGVEDKCLQIKTNLLW